MRQGQRQRCQHVWPTSIFFDEPACREAENRNDGCRLWYDHGTQRAENSRGTEKGKSKAATAVPGKDASRAANWARGRG